LSYAALQNADLSSAESTADLQDAPLWFLKKEATNLTDANLSYAALQDADLSNAYLSGADLTHANLTDADLIEAKGWTMEQLTAARSLEKVPPCPTDRLSKAIRCPTGRRLKSGSKTKRAAGGTGRTAALRNTADELLRKPNMRTSVGLQSDG